MRSSLAAAFFLLAFPLPYVEATPSLEEDAVVEVTRTARRAPSIVRETTHLLRSTAPVPPTPTGTADVLPQAPDVEPASAFTRPPPAR